MTSPARPPAVPGRSGAGSGEAVGEATLDPFDYALLREVQVDNQLKSQELGARVGLSATTVQRRLRRMRRLGVISADVALVSPATVGNRLAIVVLVTLEREQLLQRRDFEKSVRARPEVTQCYYVAGEMDFVLILRVPDMEAYTRFSDEVFWSNPSVTKFHTIVAMSTIKFSTQVDLSDLV
jgi:Lrp/AsnC family transcriptional regulator, leucine-responsive regulatory protein